MALIVSIKRQIFRNYFRLRGKIHVRHWRGHGVHSPFMYGIVRNVFMNNRITGSDRSLYQALIKRGVGQKTGILLQNLYTHCQMDQYVLIGNSTYEIPNGRVFCVLLPQTPLDIIATVAPQTLNRPCCLVMLSPYRTTQKWKLAQQLCDEHPCVSVDRRVMMLYFVDPKLQPQHYRI